MVYKTEYSTRRVYSSDPRPTVTSYSYSYNPIARRRAKPVIISSRVIRTPYPAPLGDQQLLNLITTPTVTRTRQYVAVDPPTTGDDNASYSRTFSSTSSTSGRGGRDRDTSGRGFDTDSFFDRPSASTSSFSSSFPSGNNTTSSKTFTTKKTETKVTDDGSGPKTTSYTTESTRNDGGPGSLFTSTTTSRGPDGIRLKHFSYK